ncbi:MAG: DNA alkylation repair protein [Phycisphaerae bacterium]|nr:DNA alkylation repair protein [Phycisphaerae bacterium]
MAIARETSRWNALLELPLGHMPPIVETRIGSSRRADIAPKVLRALNDGLEETRTLAEWLAIDQPRLLASALSAAGLGTHVPTVVGAARIRADLRFTDRLKSAANDLRGVFQSLPAPDSAVRSFATSPSDMIRGWLAYAISYDETLSLDLRLNLATRFAADRSMAVREVAWDALRPHLVRDLPTALVALAPWTHHESDGVRRCAIEATRPRGVWCRHIDELKRDPARGLLLLEAVRADPSKYVLRSAANWLNDASKDRPDWVRQTCARWTRESSSPQTQALVRHALRTIG